MALTKCRECGKEISTQANACPHCGYVIKKAPSKSNSGCGPVAGVIMVLIIGSLLWPSFKKGYERGSGRTSTAKPAPSFRDMDALYLCQQAMKSASIDPDKAEVPYVTPTEDGSEWHFAWGASTKRMRMRNGLGLDVPATGSCSVSKTQKRIAYLTINGDTVIAR